jgi:cellulose synthase/poly-beta-1,6-N-acetylglucosamine synthase-like glycosyltransferase
MLSSFQFQTLESDSYDQLIKTAKVRKIYTAESGKLILIDKDNGGKADAINAAINFAKGEYICTIDADSILDRQALKHVVRPLIEDRSVFVSGGQIALSNDLIIAENKVVSARMPGKIIILWQILEYISTFMIARISLSKMNTLLIMSGAFSIFRKNDLLSVGGFLTKHNDHPFILQSIGKEKQVLTEDMEIVVRLWKYFKDSKRKARAVFLPGPVCWTEAPEKFRQLYKQRARWHQGLAETIWLYRHMIFEPKYGTIGIFAIPYYFFLEFLAPLLKIVAIPVGVILITDPLINKQWVLFFMLGTMVLYTIIMSSLTVLIEQWSMRQQASTNRDALRYKTFTDWIILLFAGISANFSFAFFKMFAQIQGIINFIRKSHNWMKIERKGIKQIN